MGFYDQDVSPTNQNYKIYDFIYTFSKVCDLVGNKFLLQKLGSAGIRRLPATSLPVIPGCPGAESAEIQMC